MKFVFGSTLQSAQSVTQGNQYTRIFQLGKRARKELHANLIKFNLSVLPANDLPLRVFEEGQLEILPVKAAVGVVADPIAEIQVTALSIR